MNQRKANRLSGTADLAWQNSGHAIRLALGLAFASAGTSMAAEPPPPAKVGVYAKHVGGKIVYYYRVTNKNQLDITTVSIGCDTRNDDDPSNDVWELSELPSGWNPKLGIPSTSSNSPTGWRVSMTSPGDWATPKDMTTPRDAATPRDTATPRDAADSGEEKKTHAITWEIINSKSPLLSTGQTLTKMSIAVDKADASYLTGHALVTFSDGMPAAVSKGAQAQAAKSSPAPAATGSPAAVTKSPPLNIAVPVELLDNRPPTLAVTLTPNTIWSPDNKYIPVSATFPIKEDDFDNLPEIKLEAITANEPLEPDDIRDASYGIDDRYLRLRAKRNGATDRVYTVTYSATDASGNQTTASATVTVQSAPTPHDQGEKGKIEVK